MPTQTILLGLLTGGARRTSAPTTGQRLSLLASQLFSRAMPSPPKKASSKSWPKAETSRRVPAAVRTPGFSAAGEPKRISFMGEGLLGWRE
jgi:hypothetical protein